MTNEVRALAETLAASRRARDIIRAESADDAVVVTLARQQWVTDLIIARDDADDPRTVEDWCDLVMVGSIPEQYLREARRLLLQPLRSPR